MDEVHPFTPAPQLKEDPQALVLRGRPRRVVRFKRHVIITATALVTATVAALAWAALQPPTFRSAAEADGKPAGPAAAEALQGAPKSYGEIPQLGPPLPGDLGPPILERQRQLASAPPDPGGSAVGWEDGNRTGEDQREALEMTAARSSSVLVQIQGSGSGEILKASEVAPAANEGRQAATIEADPVQTAERTSSLRSIAASPSRLSLQAGTVIPASLITGINSDIPGLVVALVAENVRDSATGQTILIPQGARLIGRYESAAVHGQERAHLLWDRLLFPDGSSLDLGKMPASDASGYSGLKGHVNAHSWQLIKGVMLSSVLGLGSELSLGGGGAIARAIRQSSQQNGSRAGEQIVARELDIPPTLTIPPGWRVDALLDEDLALQPWKDDRSAGHCPEACR
jgi:type IV secretory pathway VirB10-like protein